MTLFRAVGVIAISLGLAFGVALTAQAQTLPPPGGGQTQPNNPFSARTLERYTGEPTSSFLGVPYYPLQSPPSGSFFDVGQAGAGINIAPSLGCAGLDIKGDIQNLLNFDDIKDDLKNYLQSLLAKQALSLVYSSPAIAGVLDGLKAFGNARFQLAQQSCEAIEAEVSAESRYRRQEAYNLCLREAGDNKSKQSRCAWDTGQYSELMQRFVDEQFARGDNLFQTYIARPWGSLSGDNPNAVSGVCNNAPQGSAAQRGCKSSVQEAVAVSAGLASGVKSVDGRVTLEPPPISSAMVMDRSFDASYNVGDMYMLAFQGLVEAVSRPATGATRQAAPSNENAVARALRYYSYGVAYRERQLRGKTVSNTTLQQAGVNPTRLVGFISSTPNSQMAVLNQALGARSFNFEEMNGQGAVDPVQTIGSQMSAAFDFMPMTMAEACRRPAVNDANGPWVDVRDPATVFGISPGVISKLNKAAQASAGGGSTGGGADAADFNKLLSDASKGIDIAIAHLAFCLYVEQINQEPFATAAYLPPSMVLAYTRSIAQPLGLDATAKVYRGVAEQMNATARSGLDAEAPPALVRAVDSIIADLKDTARQAEAKRDGLPSIAARNLAFQQAMLQAQRAGGRGLDQALERDQRVRGAN